MSIPKFDKSKSTKTIVKTPIFVVSNDCKTGIVVPHKWTLNVVTFGSHFQDIIMNMYKTDNEPDESHIIILDKIDYPTLERLYIWWQIRNENNSKVTHNMKLQFKMPLISNEIKDNIYFETDAKSNKRKPTKKDKALKNISNWVKKLTHEEIFKLSLAADYMQIDELTQLLSAMAAIHINTNTPTKIKTELGIGISI